MIAIDTAIEGAAAVDAVFLFKCRHIVRVLKEGSMDICIEVLLLLDIFKLGLEVIQSKGATIGTTALVGEFEVIVMDLLAWPTPLYQLANASTGRWHNGTMGKNDYTPVATTATFLLDLVWSHVYMTRFGKVAREVVFRRGRTIGEADMVTIVALVGASHCEGDLC